MTALVLYVRTCYHLRGSFEGELPCWLNMEHEVPSIQILHHKEQVGLTQIGNRSAEGEPNTPLHLYSINVHMYIHRVYVGIRTYCMQCTLHIITLSSLIFSTHRHTYVVYRPSLHPLPPHSSPQFGRCSEAVWWKGSQSQEPGSFSPRVLPPHHHPQSQHPSSAPSWQRTSLCPSTEPARPGGSEAITAHCWSQGCCAYCSFWCATYIHTQVHTYCCCTAVLQGHPFSTGLLSMGDLLQGKKTTEIHKWSEELMNGWTVTVNKINLNKCKQGSDNVVCRGTLLRDVPISYLMALRCIWISICTRPWVLLALGSRA